MFDLVSGNQSLFNNYTVSRWSYYDGVPAAVFVENSNGAASWPAFACDTNTLAVSLWMHSGAQTAQRCALSIGSSGLAARVLVNTTGTIGANWSTTTIAQTSSFSDTVGKWTHVVIQRSRAAAFAELWVNGSLDVRTSSTLSQPLPQINMAIGNRRDGTTLTNPYTGAIDDVRIYQRTLSYTEIELLASQRLIGFVRR
jgi:hypothetical protein